MNKAEIFPSLKSLFSGKTNNYFLQLFRYTFVGGFAFMVDFGTLYILTDYLKIYYLISAGIAFILGLIVNYLLSIKWVFNVRVVENHMLEFLIFSLIGLVGLGLTEFFLWLFTDILLIYYLVSKAITAFMVYFWNFTARKIFLFNKKQSLQ